MSQTITIDQNLIKIEDIKIEGNTVFSDSELENTFTPIEGKSVTLERLFQIISTISRYYHNQGYINSSAFLPSQMIEDGILIIKVVEGRLSTLEIEGLSGLNESYIRSRLPINKPIKTSDLSQALNNLREDTLIKEIDAELKVIGVGKNLLFLKIEENKSIQTELRFTNAFSPTIGSLGGELTLKHHNLLGFGDRVFGDYTRTEGLERYGIGYSFPFNTTGGRIALDYTDADSELIEDVISAFDINADFEAYKLSIRQPVIKNETEELAFSLNIEKLRSETFVAEDISFPFVDGLEDGVSRITPLRLATEYTKRGKSSLIAAESKFSFGLDVLDVTKTETEIDGIFWSWLGNVQWIKAFDSRGEWLFKTSLLTQLTSDNLLPLEQFTVGGLGSVRGYRQNLIVGDNGIVVVVEGQLPIIKKNIYLVPFADFGTVWSNSSDPLNTQTSTLASLGLQINYQIEEFLNAKVFYGIPLSDTEDFGDSSAEERWGFSLSLVPLTF